MKNVLIACEYSGVIRRAFREAGFNAWSCDLKPSWDGSPFHHTGDVREVLRDNRRWDLMIAHPECTYLCGSGWHWTVRDKTGERMKKSVAAFEFARWLIDEQPDIPRICMENSRGKLGTWLRHCDQEVQPYQFGEDASKATQFWLKNLPPLKPTAMIAPRLVNGKKRWANQTDSGQNKVPGTKRQSDIRSATYPGIANAMVTQWGPLLLEDAT